MDFKHQQRDNGVMIFGSSLMRKEATIPKEFIWPQKELVHAVESLNEPLVNLQGVLTGDNMEISKAAKLVREACSKHGFFQVTNHGADARLLSAAHDYMDGFFKLPIEEKLRVSKKPGSLAGYSNAHATRFSSNLPWKETLSFGYHENESRFGTGPHTDPTSLTILHQDQVGGLEVFSQNKWKAVQPKPDALVINIGDTFQALSNGIYKSCLHRAVVNSSKERRSVAIFVCPNGDKVVRPPEDLFVDGKETRKYPDFTWSLFFEFTQKHYRADVSTLQSFTNRLLSQPAA